MPLLGLVPSTGCLRVSSFLSSSDVCSFYSLRSLWFLFVPAALALDLAAANACTFSLSTKGLSCQFFFLPFPSHLVAGCGPRHMLMGTTVGALRLGSAISARSLVETYADLNALSVQGKSVCRCVPLRLIFSCVLSCLLLCTSFCVSSVFR